MNKFKYSLNFFDLVESMSTFIIKTALLKYAHDDRYLG